MDWKSLDRYFDVLRDSFVENLLANAEYPWSPLEKLKDRIESFFVSRSHSGNINASPKVITNKDGTFREASFFITETQILDHDFIDPNHFIFIGAGTLLEAGATIKNHSIVESNCEIRQGAYIRGFVYIGERSVIGHTTEIKQTIFIRHVEAGHFSYIGDSIIGSYVNLGAGTKISNLEFRTLEAKQEDRFPEITFRVDKENIKTGVSKFGAIVGDGCETGCNSVLSPFVFLEPSCWILPNFCVPKGIYKKGSLLRQRPFKKIN